MFLGLLSRMVSLLCSTSWPGPTWMHTNHARCGGEERGGGMVWELKGLFIS